MIDPFDTSSALEEKTGQIFEHQKVNNPSLQTLL